MISRDSAHLQALLITPEEIAELGLPAQEAARIQGSIRTAGAKFQAAVAKITTVNDKTRWLHLETGALAVHPRGFERGKI